MDRTLADLARALRASGATKREVLRAIAYALVVDLGLPPDQAKALTPLVYEEIRKA